jgi:hypothetical protein
LRSRLSRRGVISEKGEAFIFKWIVILPVVAAVASLLGLSSLAGAG